MEMLEEIKLLKGISDNAQNQVLELIINESEKRLLTYINKGRDEKLKSVPEEIDYIQRDVAIARFNRLDSEGTKKHMREGETFDWEDYLSKNHYDTLSLYHDADDDHSKPGRIRFIGW